MYRKQQPLSPDLPIERAGFAENTLGFIRKMKPVPQTLHDLTRISRDDRASIEWISDVKRDINNKLRAAGLRLPPHRRGI